MLNNSDLPRHAWHIFLNVADTPTGGCGEQYPGHEHEPGGCL